MKHRFIYLEENSSGISYDSAVHCAEAAKVAALRSGKSMLIYRVIAVVRPVATIELMHGEYIDQ